ncbi:MAG: SNF2-related protein, partial [Bacteroidota bacterium]
MNTGADPIFSEFIVWNPSSNSSYTVNIRTRIPKKGLPPENTLTSVGNTCNCQDFKTSRLGLCKHISATLHQVLKQRGAKKTIAAGYRPLYSMIYVDYRHGRRIRLFVGVKQEAQLLKWCTRFCDAEGYLAPETLPLFEKLLREVRLIQPEFICTDDVFDLIAEEHEKRRLKERLIQALPNGPEDKYLDKLLKVKLFPYQKRGVWFAVNAGRCLIADEMGLGKTVQAIGVAELLRREMDIQRVLIVCPTSLKYQWKTEIEKFTHASVYVVEGLQ